MEWESISTAPRDGTPVVLGNSKWETMPIATWGSHPDNPVQNGAREDIWMKGWLIKDDRFCVGCEDGFLGWSEDEINGVMPTHWMPLPPPSNIATGE